MNRRRLGRTGLNISELVFGGGWVGGILVDADDETRIEALRRAYQAGINWIDTAPSYGDTASETALGRLLPEVKTTPDNPLMLSTKVRIDLEQLNDVSGQIERSIEESLKRLKQDKVTLFQLHNQIGIKTDGERLGVDTILGKGGVVETFDKLRDQGLFAHTGFTALGETRALVKVIESGRFDTAQVYYNMLNSSAGRDVGDTGGVQDFGNILARMKRRDMGVLVIRVFAAGVIATDVRTGREIMVADGTDVEVDEGRVRRVFEALGRDYGSRAQTAIRYALANPDVHGVIFGLASLEHLDEAIEAARQGPLDELTAERIDTIVDGAA